MDIRINIKINPKYESAIPHMNSREYKELVSSIAKYGQKYPIIVNPEGFILDGHHRHRACQELSIETKWEVMSFDSPSEEYVFVLLVNLHRRHLAPWGRARVGKELLRVESELARQRQSETIPQKGQKGFQPVSCSNEHHTEEGKARDIVADKIDVSPITFQRAIYIMGVEEKYETQVAEVRTEEAEEKLKWIKNITEKLDNDEKISISYAYAQVKREEEKFETPSLPEGTFNVIYADPPWDYYIQTRGSPDSHFQTMSNEELCDLDIPSISAEDCVLFLWTTTGKYEETLKIIEAWGFTYKSQMVWVKDKFGTGYYVRNQHELLLITTKGNPGVPAEADRPPSVVYASREEHSRKPKEFYGIIEKMYPAANRIELFKPDPPEGWTGWGVAHE